jgi:hypothetical protein
MCMKLFVSCVGDLATVGGSVLVLTSFQLLPDSFSFFLFVLRTSKFFYSGDLLTLWLSCVPERGGGNKAVHCLNQLTTATFPIGRKHENISQGILYYQ